MTTPKIPSQKISNTKLMYLLCAGAGLMLPTIGSAEVKSLTSSELTDTYIKDSTIIVTPKKKDDSKAKQTTVSSLTIAPVDRTDQDFDQLEHSQQHSLGTSTAFALNDESLRNNNVESALFPLENVDIPTYQERTTLPVADILNDERYRVPEGDFDLSFLGEQGIGLSRNGDQLTFSIGNPSQIPNQIEIPNGLNEAPIEIVPRAGGGFDLTINIPQNN